MLLKSHKFIILLASLIAISSQMAFAAIHTYETTVTIVNKTDYKVQLSVEQESTWGAKGARARRWTTLDEEPEPGQTLKGYWRDWASGTEKQNEAKLKIGDAEIQFRLLPNAPPIKQTVKINGKDVEIAIKTDSEAIELIHEAATSLRRTWTKIKEYVTEGGFYNYTITIDQINPKSRFSNR